MTLIPTFCPGGVPKLRREFVAHGVWAWRCRMGLLFLLRKVLGPGGLLARTLVLGK